MQGWVCYVCNSNSSFQCLTAYTYTLSIISMCFDSRNIETCVCGYLHSSQNRRLSSVSSNEGVSTADLPDAFSPPVTPRLAAPLASPHPLPSSLPSSPLHTSTYIQSPTVRFTPDLQPQYLLMQFPLPLKKVTQNYCMKIRKPIPQCSFRLY